MANELTVDVNVEDLKTKVAENLADHTAKFEEAKAAYTEAISKALDIARRDLKRDGIDKFNRNFLYEFPEPQSFAGEYQAVLDMLAWEKRDVVTLTRRDFERYVSNKWEWAAGFAAVTSNYVR